MDEVLNRIVSLLPRKPNGTLVHGCKKALTDYLGLPSNTMAEWISGRNKSYRNYIAQIAEYYSVSANWILGVSEKKIDISEDSEDVDEEMYELMTELRDNYALRQLLHAAKGTDAENIKAVAEMLERFKNNQL